MMRPSVYSEPTITRDPSVTACTRALELVPSQLLARPSIPARVCFARMRNRNCCKKILSARNFLKTYNQRKLRDIGN